MIDGNGGTDRSIPPSFAPSGARRRPGADAVRADAAGTGRTGADPATPPSFSPASSRQGRPSSDAAPSRSHAAHAEHGSTRRADDGPEGSESGQPRSFVPPAARQARRSSGSSRNAAVSPAVSPAVSYRPPPRNGVHAPSAVPGRPGQARPAARTRRRIRPARILFATLMLLVVLLALALFGAWNWVDGKLERDSWLTGMADSSGATSWLLVGSDKRDSTEGVSGADDQTVTGFRTDTLLVLTRPKNGPSSLISIPRDSLVEVDGQYMKINAVAQVYGNKALTGEVEQITGQKIDHVAEIQFGGLKNVVDAVGGVNLCYDQDVDDAYSGLKWTSGCHDADGTTALAFSRMRYSDAQGDFGRAARQRQVIAAVMKKTLSAGTLLNPSKVARLADAGLGSLTVDEDTDPMTLAAMAMAFRDATGASGVTGSLYWSNPDYYVDGVGSSVLLDDTANSELFAQLAAGKHAAGEVGTLAEN